MEDAMKVFPTLLSLALAGALFAAMPAGANQAAAEKKKATATKKETKWQGNASLPQSLGIPDPTNNVEVIRIDDPKPGEYWVQISAANLLQTKPGQDFSLVVTAKGLTKLNRA